MDEIKGLIDKLPAPARHAVIAFAGTWGGSVLNRVVDAKGVSSVEWSQAIVNATDAAFYSTSVIMLALYITPLTRQYGLRKNKPNVQDVAD